jgi:transposase
VAKVVLEATGGYERTVRGYLGEAGIPVTVLNPQRARAFAEFKGKLSKTDTVDAATLAEIAERGDLDPTPPPDKHLERLTALVTRREQVVGMLTMEKNRWRRRSDVTKPWIQQTIATLTDQLTRLNGEIAATVKGNPAWHENDRLLRSVKGIGPVTSAAVLAHLPEIGTISNKKVAALVGVAPFAADSGSRSGVRFIRGGRANIRRALYMAAISACRAQGPVRSFYLRLLDKGKPRKVAIVAGLHKMLRMANAVIRKQQMWDPDWRNVSRAAQTSDRSSAGVKEVGGLGGGAPQHLVSEEPSVESREEPQPLVISLRRNDCSGQRPYGGLKT